MVIGNAGDVDEDHVEAGTRVLTTKNTIPVEEAVALQERLAAFGVAATKLFEETKKKAEAEKKKAEAEKAEKQIEGGAAATAATPATPATPEAVVEKQLVYG